MRVLSTQNDRSIDDTFVFAILVRALNRISKSGHVLKLETTKRNERNETPETTETTETSETKPPKPLKPPKQAKRPQ